MTPQEHICIKCKHVVMHLGSATGDTTSLALCTRKNDQVTNQPVVCPSERFQDASLERNVCGGAGIFWEPKV